MTTSTAMNSSSAAAGRVTLLLWILALLLLLVHGQGGGGGEGTEIPPGSDNGGRNTSDSRATTAVPDVPVVSTTFRYAGQNISDEEMLEMSKQFVKDVAAQRKNASLSIIKFPFSRNRIRVLTRNHEILSTKKGVLYWMNRDQRLHDNWALLYAQKYAILDKVPLYIVFCRPRQVDDSNNRIHHFMIEGLKEIEKECLKMNIQFHFIIGYAEKVIPDFVKKYEIGLVILDFLPFKHYLYVAKFLALAIGTFVPVSQIDAHNVVPCWHASDKQEYNLAMFHQALDKKTENFLTEFPPLIKHPFSSERKAEPINWEKLDKDFELDRSVPPLHGFKPGYDHGMHVLNTFIQKNLKRYIMRRRNPLVDGLSNLSPWLNLGHISAQRAILEIQKHKKSYKGSIKIFTEEILDRRELSDNYCFYNKNYTNLANTVSWGRNTLDSHRNDTREYVYTREEFENSRTHDDLWNAMNTQMIKEGKIHRFLRSYWGKKILEFSKSPEEALDIANYLNNKYSIDAHDPNGYVGVLWAIAGLHDIQCNEREVFGKVRYMTSSGCRTKFIASDYIAKYGGKSYARAKN